MQTKYEKTLNFNPITRLLHSIRYKNLIAVVKSPELRSGPIKIVDIGCGTAKSYEVIASVRSDFKFVGVEPSVEFCKAANDRYSSNGNFEIINGYIQDNWDLLKSADVILGLESFEHIPESLVVRLCENIGECQFKVLYVTVPNEVGPAILIKNVGSWLMGYVRHKEYSWSETMHAGLYNLDRVKIHGTGHIGFDWRWLAATLRQNVIIEKYTRSPSRFVPRFASPSIGFICKPRQR